MTYEWKCLCGAILEVTRRMSEYNVGPKNFCPRCGGSSTFYMKMVSKPAAPMVVGGRSERTPYPLKIDKLHKTYNPDGSITRTDMIFANHAQQKEYMDKHDLCLFMDGEADSTFSAESQHSVWTQNETPSPSAEAEQLAKKLTWVEQPDGTFL